MDWKVPELGEGVYEAELVAWHIKPGDTVKRGQNLMEVMTDKATMEVPSSFVGTISSLHAEPGVTIHVGDMVLAYTPTGKDDGEPHESREAVKERAAPEHNGGKRAAVASPRRAVAAPSGRAAASPAVRYMARKLGIDLNGVAGSGPAGRILLDDLTAHLSVGAKPQAAPIVEKPDYGTPGTRIRLAGLRRKVAEHMVLSKKVIPHYTYVDECDVSDLVRLREQLKEPFARQGVKLTYLAFFVKAVVAALKEVPVVNSTLDESANEIILHDNYHIGVAVAVPGGLIVPVVRDADKKDLGAVAREIERLSNDARTGKVKLDDLRGGTFTISSVGNVGGLISTPIIPHPEVGILGIGKVVRRPVYDPAGNIRPADILYLSLSLDHRVVDGVVGAAFANVVIKQLQSPAAMLIG